MTRDLGWDDMFYFLVTLVTLWLLGLTGFVIFQDHSVQFYYISNHGVQGGMTGYCIDGYRNWYMNDSGVFCSDDIQKTISVLKELNDDLAARKRAK